MKTLKTLTAAFLMILSFSAFANDESISNKNLVEYTVKTYVDAVSHGKTENLSEVLDRDVKYTFTRGEKIYSYGKSDILKFMKGAEHVDQQCITETAIIEQNATQIIVKVSMKYDGFTNVNYLNIANTTKGWKITNITRAFN